MAYRRAAALAIAAIFSISRSANAFQVVAGCRVRVEGYRVERDVRPGRNRGVGRAVNISGRRLRDVRARFRVFDARGRRIGWPSDSIMDLRAGQSWRFRAPAAGNVSRARLASADSR
ncbi:FxLYD domain-containing protein [Dyella humicola]|uniref:FxLYD domain-containing protein n=1 Tax=Dyella humicola TaxID=2992126 RepID=UPI003CE4D418